MASAQVTRQRIRSISPIKVYFCIFDMAVPPSAFCVITVLWHNHTLCYKLYPIPALLSIQNAGIYRKNTTEFLSESTKKLVTLSRPLLQFLIFFYHLILDTANPPSYDSLVSEYHTLFQRNLPCANPNSPRKSVSSSAPSSPT